MSIAEDERRWAVLKPLLERGTLDAAWMASAAFWRDEKHDDFFPPPDRQQLEQIYTARPRILASLNEETLKTLQVAASAGFLAGMSRFRYILPAGFSTGLRMENDAAVRMIIFRAAHDDRIKSFASAEVRQIRWHAFPSADPEWDCCEACGFMDGRVFDLSKAPEQPYEFCTSHLGCRCTYFMVNP